MHRHRGLPDHGGTDFDLLKSADRSMYEAKLGGRDRIRLRTDTMVEAGC